MAESNNRSYACDLCPRAFTTVQALGGHQNAHRKERRAARSLENQRKLPFIRQAEMDRLLFAHHWAASSGYNRPTPGPANLINLPGPGPAFGPPPQTVVPPPEAQTELDLSLKL